MEGKADEAEVTFLPAGIEENAPVSAKDSVLSADAASVIAARCGECFKDSMITELGIKLLPPSDGVYRATMPVDHRTCQHLGVVCGGASLALAEITAGYASMATLGLDCGKTSVGQQVSASHVAPAPLGSLLTATATPLHVGRSTHVWSVDIKDQNGRRISVAQVTNAVIAAPKTEK